MALTEPAAAVDASDVLNVDDPTGLLDVLIVGAGISGIGAAVHLQQHCPTHCFRILEARDSLGGTWDLFRYPGVRSDSDMHTLGYSFRPWTGEKAIAPGAEILDYLRETVAEHGLAPLISYQTRVISARWDSETGLWTVTTASGANAAPTHLRCRFLHICSGYYRYDQGHCPEFAGAADFQGRIVHPQHWPQDLALVGKQVVVIGSGATAVTLVPALASQGAQVTMLQRSPTYMVSRPSRDALSDWLRRHLGAGPAYRLTRWKNVLLGMAFFQAARRWPDRIAQYLIADVQGRTGPGVDISHFTPRYKPWDQRLCLVPDADLFKAMRRGQARVLTDEIERLTPGGIRLKSGQELAADLVVTATGLELLALGGIRFEVDGKPVPLGTTVGYRGMMLSGLPNLACVFGYVNASWTLRADLTSRYLCRILNHMRRHGWDTCTPVLNDARVSARPWMDLSSGYIQRALHRFPQQGTRAPWQMQSNYLLESLSLRLCRLDDGSLRFARATKAAKLAP